MLGTESPHIHSTSHPRTLVTTEALVSEERRDGKGEEEGGMLVDEEWGWPTGFHPPSDFLSDAKKVWMILHLQQDLQIYVHCNPLITVLPYPNLYSNLPLYQPFLLLGGDDETTTTRATCIATS